MESYKHTEVSSAKFVRIKSGWKREEFAFTSATRRSVELFLENDRSKKLELLCSNAYDDDRRPYSFGLFIRIQAPWACRGNCTSFARADLKRSVGRVVDFSCYGDDKGTESHLVLETVDPWTFVEIDFMFFLYEAENDPMGVENYPPMSCNSICRKLLANDTKAPWTFALKVEQKEIMVHGCLLSMHSEVFKRMIEQDGFREGREKVVDITDSDYDSVMAMVRFMHGFSDGVRDHAEGVLALADKYAVQPLKEFAVSMLKERIGRSTVAHIAAVAFLYNVPTLFQECKEYVAANFREVSVTEGWKNLCDTNTELLAKLVMNSY